MSLNSRVSSWDTKIMDGIFWLSFNKVSFFQEMTRSTWTIHMLATNNKRKSYDEIGLREGNSGSMCSLSMTMLKKKADGSNPKKNWEEEMCQLNARIPSELW